MSTEAELAQLQSWFQRLITDPGGVSAADQELQQQGEEWSLERDLLPSRQLTTAQRVGVYASGYFLRLVEILQGDFSGLEHAVGNEGFDLLARAYIQRFPSAHFSLNQFGARMPEFLEEFDLSSLGPEAPRRSFLVDLARLEWSVQVVFDAPRVTPVTVDEWAAVPSDRSAGVQFELVPAHRLLALESPLNNYLQAVRDDQLPVIPPPGESFVLVYRVNSRVLRLDIDAAQYSLLGRLREGATLGDALAQLLQEESLIAEAAMASVGDWFRDWASFGLFQSLRGV